MNKMTPPRVYTLSSKAADEIRKCLPKDEGEFETALILKSDGSVDVVRAPDAVIAGINRTTGRSEVFKPVKGTSQKAILKQAKASNRKNKKKIIDSLTTNKIVKDTTPIVWTTFENSGCICIATNYYYC